jgi:hypothetical protein
MLPQMRYFFADQNWQAIQNTGLVLQDAGEVGRYEVALFGRCARQWAELGHALRDLGIDVRELSGHSVSNGPTRRVSPARRPMCATRQ